MRHGETAWALTGQHTGRTDLPLTPNGETEARALAAPLRNVTFNHVFTSPRQRARRTCELAGLAAHAVIGQAWQRYYEPFVLILFAMMAATSLRDSPDGDPPRRWRLIGPAALAVLLAVLTHRAMTAGAA